MESTKENRVWHSGPPPHVGWWNTNRRRDNKAWAWWDGVAWSTPVADGWNAKFAGYWADVYYPLAARVEWNDYWPADARVPRLAPEDFDVGARWVLTRTEPVGFKGQEFTVYRWGERGLLLHATGCMVLLSHDELPSERFVPRRCIGPQTRWDFPVLREHAVAVKPSATGLVYSDRQCNTAGDVPNPRDVARARVLAAQGYRRISNAHGMVARIDRPDWVDVLAKALHRAPADFYVPGESEPAGNWRDHYRRCYSKDEQKLDRVVAKLVPTSGHDNVGYVPPFKAEIQ